MERFKGMLLGVVLLGAAAGCGSPIPEAEAGTLESDEATEAQALTPEELQALVEKASQPNPELMQAMFATCQPSSVNHCVNAGYGSCAAWSAWGYCGNGAVCSGIMCTPGYCEIVNRTKVCYAPEYQYSETQNRYRVCFNGAGQSCTEYELYSVTTCTPC